MCLFVLFWLSCFCLFYIGCHVSVCFIFAVMFLFVLCWLPCFVLISEDFIFFQVYVGCHVSVCFILAVIFMFVLCWLPFFFWLIWLSSFSSCMLTAMFLFALC